MATCCCPGLVAQAGFLGQALHGRLMTAKGLDTRSAYISVPMGSSDAGRASTMAFAAST